VKEVKLDDDLRGLLEHYRKKSIEQKLRSGTKHKESHHVFINLSTLKSIDRNVVNLILTRTYEN